MNAEIPDRESKPGETWLLQRSRVRMNAEISNEAQVSSKRSFSFNGAASG